MGIELVPFAKRLLETLYNGSGATNISATLNLLSVRILRWFSANGHRGKSPLLENTRSCNALHSLSLLPTNLSRRGSLEKLAYGVEGSRGFAVIGTLLSRRAAF
jgi:hypothetical protein